MTKPPRLRRLTFASLVALLALSLLPQGPVEILPAAAQAASLFQTTPRRVDYSGGRNTLAAGDLDGDGWLDLVMGNEVFLNENRAVFNANWRETYLGVPTVLEDLVLADMTGDGALDIVVALGYAGLWLFANNGAGKFEQAPVKLREGTSNQPEVQDNRLAVGDLNGDGRFDVVSARAGGMIYFGNDQGGFTASPAIDPSGPPIADLALGFFDAGNTLDVVLLRSKENGASPGVSAVFLNNGQGVFTPGPSLNPAGNYSVDLAVGDVSGDGVADIVLANRLTYSAGAIVDPGATVVYVNDGAGGFPAGSARTLSPGGFSSALALADASGDGRLDILVGAEQRAANAATGAPAHAGGGVAFVNQGGTFGAAQPILPAGTATAALAVADVSGDGRPDLVHSGDGIYLNAGLPNFSPGTILQAADTATQTAAADLTGDGLLDAIVARVGETTFYPNLGGGSFGPARAITSPGRFAVADLTGDGQLDLAVGKPGAPGEIWVNNGQGSFTLAAALTMPAADYFAAPPAVAVADFTGDGPVDVVLVGSEKLRLFVNSGQGSFTAAPATNCSRDCAGTPPFAVADFNADTLPDLVLGGDGADVYVSRRLRGFDWGWLFVSNPDYSDTLAVAVGNFGGYGFSIVTATAEGVWLFNPNYPSGFRTPVLLTAIAARALAVGDVSGDDVPDIVVAAIDQPETILVNDGSGSFTAAPGPAGSLTGALGALPQGELLTLADLTGDGVLDILAGGNGGATRVSPGTPLPLPRTADTPPRVRIGAIITARAGGGYATPQVLEGPYVAVPFTLFDAESDPVSKVVVSFSSLSGATVPLRAPVELRNLPASPAGTPYTIFWDVASFRGQSDDVRLHIAAVHAPQARKPPAGGGAWRPSVVEPLQYGAWGATSERLRVRGIIARVVSARRPGGEVGATVYRMRNNSFRQERGALGQSNHGGFVANIDGLSAGDSLFAVQQITTTGKLTYAMTSGPPTSAGVAALPITGETRGVQTLTVSPDYPLLLLNLRIALEWEILRERDYREQLQLNLRRTSELLYDWSDGQIALGDLVISTYGFDDPDTDIQIYASNQLRPNATQGGIVRAEQTVTYTVDLAPKAVTYEPGKIRIGASWSSDGDAGSQSNEDWARALAHEIGHYALFLDETYLGREGNLLVPVEGCASPMADPYADSSSEFRPGGESSWSGDCLKTLQHRTSGMAEWPLIKRNYDRPALAPGIDFTLNEPTSLGANPGPAELPFDITTFDEKLFNGEGVLLDRSTTYRVVAPGGARYEPSPSARAVFFEVPGYGPPLIAGIRDMGAPAGDQVLARGIEPQDRLCVFDPEQQLAGCQTSGSQLSLRPVPDWRPELRVTPITFPGPTGATTMTLALEVPAVSVGPQDTWPAALQAQLFAPGDTEYTQPLTITLARDGSGPDALYRGAFENLPTVLEAGYVRLWVADESGREALADFAIGGNPAPRRKPPRRSRRNAPAVSPDGQATLFSEDTSFNPGDFLAIQSVPDVPAPPPWATLVSQGYRLVTASPALLANPDKPLALSLAYAEGDVPPGFEADVRVIFYDGTSWTELTTRLNRRRNEAAVTVQPRPGIYTLATSLRLRFDQPGWSLFYAYPGASQPLPAALAAATGRYSHIYGYDEEQRDPPWNVFSPTVPAWVNDLSGLEHGASYWLRTTEPVTVALKLPDATLQQAQALLPPPPMSVFGALSPAWDFAPQAGLTVVAEIDGQACGRAVTEATGADGVGFVIHINARGTDDTTSCGFTGAQVQLRFLDGARLVNERRLVWDNQTIVELRPTRVYLPFSANGRAAASPPATPVPGDPEEEE